MTRKETVEGHQLTLSNDFHLHGHQGPAEHQVYVQLGSLHSDLLEDIQRKGATMTLKLNS